jgi:hypothetical protein
MTYKRYSRRGVIFHIPRRYLRLFPNRYIEGEFWYFPPSSFFSFSPLSSPLLPLPLLLLLSSAPPVLLSFFPPLLSLFSPLF